MTNLWVIGSFFVSMSIIYCGSTWDIIGSHSNYSDNTYGVYKKAAGLSLYNYYDDISPLKQKLKRKLYVYQSELSPNLLRDPIDRCPWPSRL